jgi:hypothetical protein
MLWVCDLFFEHSITFTWLRFAGKMLASNILYNLLRVQEDERRAIKIVNQVEKIMDAAGIEPVTSR